MSRTIRHQFTFPQPPEIVWEYLTQPELLALWLMPNDISPVLGHKFQFRTKPMPRFGFDGIVHCEILEVQPCKKLSYSWKGGMLDTIVEWTLTPAANGTTLLLEHKGFKGFKNLLPYFVMNGGWAKIGKRFFQKLNQA